MASIHIHGFPGTGKSSIVRNLAAEFPFNGDDALYVKYFIECSDCSEDIVASLKSLLKEMLQCNLVRSPSACEFACEQLNKQRTDKFVNILESAAIPVIIVIEDPPEESAELVHGLVGSFQEKKSRKPVHLCVTSRSEYIGHIPSDQTWTKVKVGGFTTDEALDLLGISQTTSLSEKEAALKIIDKLRGSPLGLTVVKTTCDTSSTSYEDYYDEYEQSLDFHQYSKKFVKDEVGPHAERLFHAIVVLLEGKGLLETMKVLSFFHHGCIPQAVIGNVIMRQRASNTPQSSKTFYVKQRESGKFINCLKSLDICSVQGKKYHETSITFHQMVFLAVQTFMTDGKQVNREALISLAALATKDIKSQADYNFMESLFPHFFSLLDYLESHSLHSGDFVARFLEIHLREAYGNTKKFWNSTSASEQLIKSASLISKEISKFCKDAFEFDVLVSKQNAPVTEIAPIVFKACLTAGKQLGSIGEQLDEYLCTVMHFKSGQRETLKHYCTNQQTIEWLSSGSKETLQINPDQLRKFRALEGEKLFLDMQSYSSVFFVDRLVAVLLSLSRVWLFQGSDCTDANREKSIWIADMVHAICQLCAEQTGINLSLGGWAAAERINIRLSKFSRQSIDKKDRRELLANWIKMASDNLERTDEQSDTVFYENSLRRPLTEIDFHKMLSLRCMVRLSYKLVAVSQHDSEAILTVKQNTDPHYEKLWGYADAYMSSWIIAPNCLVYCGKYKASLGDYETAIGHFRTALSCEGVSQNRSNIFPWVCYNYAKAVVVDNERVEDSIKHDALAKCNEAMKFRDVTAKDLQNKLQKQCQLLDSFLAM